MPKRKPRNGDYIELVWDGDPAAEYLYGHIHRQKAVEILTKETGKDASDWYGYTFTRGWAKWATYEQAQDMGVNAPPDADLVLCECKKESKGSFPVTIIKDITHAQD